MEVNLSTRVKHAWNAFVSNPQSARNRPDTYGFSYRPDRPRLSYGNERSIITSVYNRIAIDAASIDVKHVRLDSNDRYLQDMDTGLNRCLTFSANIDQSGRAFIQDAVLSMMDEGCVALVPIDTDTNPDDGSFDILSIRVGKILEWFPDQVRVSVYNDRTGKKEEIVVPKRSTAIVENPMYAIMNEPNSTLQRLIHKLVLLDAVDEQSSSGKLDLIIQLPYVIKTEARRVQAEKRRKDIEMQLSGSKYGIAYTDGTEHITQLNRPIENNLMKQIEYLSSTLYSQLGITQAVLDGTADEKTMLNYVNRTIEPIMSAITDEMKRKFLTKTAISQHQSIEFFRDPFRLVPVADLAEVADKFTRNEIMSTNEFRQIIGMKPSMDPRADELRNKNLNAANDQLAPEMTLGQEELDSEEGMTEEEFNREMAAADELDAQLDELEDEMGGPVAKHYASPYYDPVKAHEYYEEHKKLSSKGLNDEGRETAKYVKEQLRKEKTDKTNASSERMKANIENMRETHSNKIESERKQVSNQVDGLRAKLKNMTPEQKERNRDRISNEIAGLRENVSNMRDRLKQAFGQFKEFESDKHSKNKETYKKEYETKLASEMEKIHKEGKFQQQKKGKKGGKKSGSSKGIIYY